LMFLVFFRIFLFFVFSVVLACIVFFLSFFISTKQDNSEKLSAYECGFTPFFDSRVEFDIKFYVVAMLFLVFDLEISFFFPFSVILNIVSITEFYMMLLFLLILTFGFLFELKKGALD